MSVKKIIVHSTFMMMAQTPLLFTNIYQPTVTIRNKEMFYQNIS